MDKQTISVRLDSDKVGALDALAEAQDRNRSELLNEAVTAYLDVQQWHLEQIRTGIRQADAGTFIEHAEIRKKFARRQKR